MGESSRAGLQVEIEQRLPVPLSLQLHCKPGRTLALFGASGSGKTSTLRAIAGLSRPSAGRIHVDGEPWFDAASRINLSPQRRSVGYVFQEYALFPHLSVLDNVQTAMRHVSSAHRLGRARALLEKVRLSEFERRRPAELSGGQRQRVAVARALAREPRVLLLDEPFSAVDASVRKSLYQELVELRRNLSMPIVLVTHDFQEVLRFADTVAIIESGRVVAHDSLEAICRRTDLPLLQGLSDPASAFDTRVVAHHPGRGLTELALGSQSLLAPATDLPIGAGARVRITARDVVLALGRVEGLSLHNQLAGRVAEVVLLPDGTTAAVYVSVEGATILAHVTKDAADRLQMQAGAPIFVLIKSVAVDTIESPAG